MSTIAQQESTPDSRIAPGLPPAHLDHAAPTLVADINAFNRVAITSHYTVAPGHRSVS